MGTPLRSYREHLQPTSTTQPARLHHSPVGAGAVANGVPDGQTPVPRPSVSGTGRCLRRVRGGPPQGGQCRRRVLPWRAVLPGPAGGHRGGRPADRPRPRRWARSFRGRSRKGGGQSPDHRMGILPPPHPACRVHRATRPAPRSAAPHHTGRKAAGGQGLIDGLGVGPVRQQIRRDLSRRLKQHERGPSSRVDTDAHDARRAAAGPITPGPNLSRMRSRNLSGIEPISRITRADLILLQLEDRVQPRCCHGGLRP